MRKIKAAAIQMKCTDNICENIDTAERLVRESAENGANIILLPELFERLYFCQQRQYDFYKYAKPVMENDAVKRFLPITEEFNIVLPVSIFERNVNTLYNTAAVLDCGKLLGIYRKTHIPDDHYYQEKFYFTPGDTGFKIWDTTYGKIGIGICWDQWFPETARCLALNGAEILLYPTAIGSEPILDCDSMPHWRRVMQGHSAANLIPVIAANRFGLETVEPSAQNAGQKSALNFYGSSFMTDNTGEIIEQAERDKETILYHTYDLDTLASDRLDWGLFRDRRPECYKKIAGIK